MSDQLCAACGQHPAYLRCPGEHVDELATLRADLARVKAERDGFEDGLTIANNAAERRGRERDAARTQVRELTAELTLTEKRRAEAQRAVHAAMVNIGTLQDQVRELQKVARAAVAWRDQGARSKWATGPSLTLWDVVDALPPSMLEEPSDG